MKQYSVAKKKGRGRRLLVRLILLIMVIVLYVHFTGQSAEVKRQEKISVTDGSFPSLSLQTGNTSFLEGDAVWQLRLVNQDNPLPEGFSIETEALPNGLEFDRRAIKALEQMLEAGRAVGLQFVVCSAYRTVSKQKELFDQEVAAGVATGLSQADAEEKAMQAIARPGESEHNLGLAADIVSYRYQHLDRQQMETAEQKWLMEHCAEYGFILRYPETKTHITGIQFEPWHYRYVGIPAAREIMEKGLCLEEYLLSA